MVAEEACQLRLRKYRDREAGWEWGITPKAIWKRFIIVERKLCDKILTMFFSSDAHALKT